MKTNKVLDKISELNHKNEVLYARKAKLEQEILSIDLEIYSTMGEYDRLVKKIYENKLY